MASSKKYTLEEVKQISKPDLIKIINKGSEYIKNHQVTKDAFKKYKADLNEIDYIPIMFEDLDVSAKTDHGMILLNYELLCDGQFEKDYSYLAHELVHYLQQTCRPDGTMPFDGEYLDNPDEQEGFQAQVNFIQDEYGESEASKYVDHLLEHHEISNNKKDKLYNKLMP